MSFFFFLKADCLGFSGFKKERKKKGRRNFFVFFKRNSF